MRQFILVTLFLGLLAGCGSGPAPQSAPTPASLTTVANPGPEGEPTGAASDSPDGRASQSNEMTSIPARETQMYLAPDVTNRMWQNAVSPEQRKSIEARRKARQRHGTVVSKSGGNGAPVMGVGDNIEQVP
ncbi:MAG: hypothetical protein KC910_34205 [Candidatus Eremiobacteraeota bacterium]|nr:hypothetical protein [Candidatus Eremiobacteraeota bacterium]